MNAPRSINFCRRARGRGSGVVVFHPQPGDLWMSLGGLNHSVGSGLTDYDNSGSFYRNANTQSGSNGVAVGHNNLQPYRVVRMWRRTA